MVPVLDGTHTGDKEYLGFSTGLGGEVDEVTHSMDMRFERGKRQIEVDLPLVVCVYISRVQEQSGRGLTNVK